MAANFPINLKDAFVAQLINTHMDYDFYCQPNGDLIAANEPFQRLFALTDDTIEGYPYLVHVHPDDATAVDVYWQRLLADNTPQSIKYRLILPDDSVRWVHWTSRLISSDHADHLAMQHVGRDVTNTHHLAELNSQVDERMRSHNIQLERLLRRVEAVLNGTVDGVALLNTDGGIEQVNLSLQTMIGREIEQLFGQSLLTIIHPDDKEMVEQVLATVQAADDNAAASLEARVQPANAAPFYAELNFSKLDKVPMDGTLLLCNIHDVTQYKHVEQSLKTNQARLRLLFESVPDALILTDSKNHIIDLNKAAMSFVDSPAEDIIGQHYTVLMPPDLQAQFADAQIAKKLKKYPRRSLDFTYIRNKTPYHFQLTIYPLTIQDNIHFLTIVRDITTSKSTQLDLLAMLAQQKLLNDEKWRFATTTSHEFRTPLATISAATELLKNYNERLTHAQRQQRLDKINQQVTHMTQILDDLLILERIAQQEQQQRQSVDLHMLVNSVLAQVQERYPAHTIELHLPAAPCIIDVDKKFLRQILHNALANAANYSDSVAEIILSITYTNDELRLTIQDSGIGIPPEEQTDVFKLFYRGSNATHYSGTGVGLAIIYRAVQIQGGDVMLDSELGKGTTLTIRLPVTSIDD